MALEQWPEPLLALVEVGRVMSDNGSGYVDELEARHVVPAVDRASQWAATPRSPMAGVAL